MAFAVASCKILLYNMLCAPLDIRKGPTRGASGGVAAGSLPAAPSGRTGFVARARGIRINWEPGTFSKNTPSLPQNTFRNLRISQTHGGQALRS